MAATAAVTVTVASATTTLQKPSVTFQSRYPQIHFVNSPNLSFSGGLRLHNLTVKIKTRSLRRRRCTMADSAAGSYATALAELATANGTLAATAADVEKLDKLFSDESILNFFISPIVSLDQKRELIDDVTSSGTLQPHVCNFINILIESKRIDLIKEMAVVTSVVQLEKQHLAQIAKQVQKLTGARNVRVKTAIDESLVAGFTIRYGNALSKLIDMSVKKQLDDIAAELEIGDIAIAV
ncbi:ATP synthase delta chain, chloroplastic-like [Bidens hawaiensis]|uniref:ATP synthase delta chain, chloroplastic-like n=1 Tax=Bidens hawaiensis TaxID=980011 RepID=UPI00404B84B9